MPTSEQVFDELKKVFDPEIPVNIVDLGLVYTVDVNGDQCKVTMSLTSRSCPSAQEIPDVMMRRIQAMDGIEKADVEVIWEPQWTPQMITEEGRKILGIDEETM